MNQKRRYRWAVIGSAGVIGDTHVKAILGNPDRAELVAVNDINGEKLAAQSAELKVPGFADWRRMLAEARPDAVTIGTPHPLHCEQVLGCFAAGAHVLCEKPLASDVNEADRMAAAARRSRKKLALCFQARAGGYRNGIKKLLTDGTLGRLMRVHMDASYFKTMCYYGNGAWRGTWGGEGGGVLMNQAPHQLDQFVDFLGLPKRVWAVNRTAHHAISVEDTSDAICEYRNGLLATMHFDVNCIPATSRLWIFGDRATLLLDSVRGAGVASNATLCRHAEPVVETIAHYPGPKHFYTVPSQGEPIELPNGDSTHKALVANFTDALDGAADLLCDGAGGVRQLELANAMMLSSYTGKPVDLPLDRRAIGRLCRRLAATETKARHRVAADPPSLNGAARKRKAKSRK